MRYLALAFRIVMIPMVLFYISYVRTSSTETALQNLNHETNRLNQQVQGMVNKMQQDFVVQLNEQLQRSQEEIRRGAQFQPITMASVGAVTIAPIDMRSVVPEEALHLENMVPALLGIFLLLEGFSSVVLMRKGNEDEPT